MEICVRCVSRTIWRRRSKGFGDNTSFQRQMGRRIQKMQLSAINLPCLLLDQYCLPNCERHERCSRRKTSMQDMVSIDMVSLFHNKRALFLLCSNHQKPLPIRERILYKILFKFLRDHNICHSVHNYCAEGCYRAPENNFRASIRPLDMGC